MGFDGFGKRDGLDTSSSATVIDGVVPVQRARNAIPIVGTQGYRRADVIAMMFST